MKDVLRSSQLASIALPSRLDGYLHADNLLQCRGSAMSHRKPRKDSTNQA